MASTVSWTDVTDDYPEFTFRHPHPLTADLWHYEKTDEWTLDLAWMDGGYEAGKEAHQFRATIKGANEAKAKDWATVYIRGLINGTAPSAQAPEAAI